MKNDPIPDRFQDADRQRRITERAFARFEARGGLHGYDVEDWLDAEREELDAEAAQAAAFLPTPGLPPALPSGDARRDEETRREVERTARAINRDAQRQLTR